MKSKTMQKENEEGTVIDLTIRRTGILELDNILHGGFPVGHVILLSGNSGSGKTVVSMQWLFSGSRKFSEPGLYLTLTEPVNIIEKNVKTMAFFEQNTNSQVRFVDLRAAANLFDINKKDLSQKDAANVVDVIIDLVKESGSKRLVIDSISAIVYLLQDKDLIRFFIFRLGAALSKLDCTTILVSEVTGDNISNYGIEEFISDGIIKLNCSKVKNEIKRTIQIVKLRGTDFNTNIHVYKIDKNGINIFPDLCVDLEYESSKERISTGNEALDKLLLGGVFKGSSTLITGSTGTGKSTLSAQFIMQGLKSQDSCLYLGFEESREQLIRNAQGYGWNLEEYEKKKILTFRCIYPRKKSLEEHLADIKYLVEKIKAKRCVLDSLSAIANAYPEEDFLSFIVDLNGYLKSQNVTVFFVSATASLLGAETLTGNNVSSITDNIIMMRYIEVQGNLKSMINILKTRGSSHSKDLRSYEITNSGIVIGQSLSGFEGIMTGITRKVSASVDEKIENEFKRFLGPMASSIFLELKNKGITRENIVEYIADLSKQGVIKQEDASLFRKQVDLILETSDSSEKYDYIISPNITAQNKDKISFLKKLLGGL